MPKFAFKRHVRENLVDGLTAKLLACHDNFVLSRSVQVLIGEQESEDIYNSMNALGPEIAGHLEKVARKIVRRWEWILSDEP